MTFEVSAIPNIESDGRLGSWLEFIESLGFTGNNESDFLNVYVDTDKLTAGVINSFAATDWSCLEHPRTESRQSVGRLVPQPGGPEIVVYDFTEILVGVPGASFPSSLVILGKRPAAIVCQGSIGAYAGNNAPSEPEEIFSGNLFNILALNSCDPDNPLGSRWAGSAAGGDGVFASVSDEGGVVSATGSGGSGGYGGSGAVGLSFTVTGLAVSRTALGGSGGNANFSWNILQPGSPGGSGGSYYSSGPSYPDNYYPNGRGGQGGGAVLIKAEGSISMGGVFAKGAGPEFFIGTGGGGSGGHVVFDTPGAVSIVSVDVQGGVSRTSDLGTHEGGGGVVEFRRTKQIFNPLDSGWVLDAGKLPVDAGSINLGALGDPQRLGVVGLPQGWAIVTQPLNYRISQRPDSCAPLITISGKRTLNVSEGSVWVDPGSSATDALDGPIEVTTSGTVNTAIPGFYEVSYSASDSSGNTASKKRYVTVVPNQPTARDPQSGLPQLVAASLRPLNPTTRAVDTKHLPSFGFVTVDGQGYPAVTFLRRKRDFMPLGSYPGTFLDRDLKMSGVGLAYNFGTSSDLRGQWAYPYSLTQITDFTFVEYSPSRGGITAPLGFEYATYRHSSSLTSSPPRFYRVVVTAESPN